MALSDFTQYALEDVSINNPTSIDFGADGRLYVTQQNGLIKALDIEKTTWGRLQCPFGGSHHACPIYAEPQ